MTKNLNTARICSCGAISENERCEICGGRTKKYWEITCFPLEGDKEFRLNTELLLLLNNFVNRKVTISIREEES